MDQNQLMIVRSNLFGEGEPDLGEKLLITFFEQLLESEKIPEKMLFINSGIFLTTENSPIVNNLKQFEIKGSKIFSCGTCLKYYNREHKLVIGSVGNMKDTVESIQSYSRIVYI